MLFGNEQGPRPGTEPHLQPSSSECTWGLVMKGQTLELTAGKATGWKRAYCALWKEGRQAAVAEIPPLAVGIGKRRNFVKCFAHGLAQSKISLKVTRGYHGPDLHRSWSPSSWTSCPSTRSVCHPHKFSYLGISSCTDSSTNQLGAERQLESPQVCTGAKRHSVNNAVGC